MKAQEVHLQMEQKKQHNGSKGRLPVITPNMIIGCVNKSAPPPVISPEHPYPRPPLAKHNLSVLDQLECPVCLDILTQPMELPCKAMACAQCIIHWVATTGSVHCPCCYSCEPIHIKLASNNGAPDAEEYPGPLHNLYERYEGCYV